MNKKDLELVWKASGFANAELIKMYLESFGIQVYVFGESVASAYGLTSTPLGEVDLMVPAHQAEEARQRLKEINEDPGPDVEDH